MPHESKFVRLLFRLLRRTPASPERSCESAVVNPSFEKRTVDALSTPRSRSSCSWPSASGEPPTTIRCRSLLRRFVRQRQPPRWAYTGRAAFWLHFFPFCTPPVLSRSQLCGDFESPQRIVTTAAPGTKPHRPTLAAAGLTRPGRAGTTKRPRSWIGPVAQSEDTAETEVTRASLQASAGSSFPDEEHIGQAGTWVLCAQLDFVFTTGVASAVSVGGYRFKQGI